MESKQQINFHAPNCARLINYIMTKVKKKMDNRTRFLETITFMGNDALVPINSIKYVNMGANDKGYKIIIKGEGDYEWTEHFENHKDAHKRYKQIKSIIGAR